MQTTLPTETKQISSSGSANPATINFTLEAETNTDNFAKTISNNMHKYKARSTIIDGIKFTSLLEARFYKYFKDKGITILEFQPRFLLQDKCTVRGENLRKIEYIADFRIFHEWEEYIVDAKWMKLPVFDLKLKLWKKRYGHETNIIIAKSIKELETMLFS